MATRDLRDELAAIPGVSDAEITFTDDDRPTAKVWLDGTRDGDEVRSRIESLLGRLIPSVGPNEPTQGKRSGLGRGLEVLLPDSALEPVPAQLRDEAGTGGAARDAVAPIDRVAVVETYGSVVVELEDRVGNLFTSTVGPGGSIDGAVLDAVKQLVGASDDTVLAIIDVAIDRPDLVVAEAVSGDARGVGIAHVGFGRPYAVASAAYQALASL